MAQVLNTTFKLKRGTAARWAEVNPILQQGEPGFVYDENRLKVGDGLTAWNDLPYIDGKREIECFDYAIEFPEVGNESTIYKAEKEQSLYQYVEEIQGYEKICGGRSVDDIQIINGGTA